MFTNRQIVQLLHAVYKCTPDATYVSQLISSSITGGNSPQLSEAEVQTMFEGFRPYSEGDANLASPNFAPLKEFLS
jgi:hypothetical protein